MIRWCGNCQKFLGETAPFENKSFSHGMCQACAEIGISMSPDQLARMRFLVSLNKRFWEAGKKENHPEMINLANEGIYQGIRPIDILFGFAGPMLYRIGELWEKNEITYLDEHQFTRACETLIDLVAKLIWPAGDHASSGPGVVLLSNVEGNIHTLGLRFVSIGLASLGISSSIVHSTLNPEALVQLAAVKKSKVVGISMAMSSQSQELQNLLLAFKNEAAFDGKIIIGGAAINKQQFKESGSSNVQLLPSPCFDETEKSFWIA